VFPVVVIRQPGQTPIHVQVREAIEVGRECTGVILVDPKVSRRHLVLAPTHTGGAAEVAVLDLGSMNGTMLAGARIDTEVVLRVGDEVRLGETTITVAEPVTAVPDLAVAAPEPEPEPEPDGATTVLPTTAAVDDAVEDAVAEPAAPPAEHLAELADTADIAEADHTGPDRTPDRTPDASVWQRPVDGTPGGSEAEPADPWG